MTKLYKVIARDLDGNIVQISDPHPWAECEAIHQEYYDRDDTATVSIIWIGVGG